MRIPRLSRVALPVMGALTAVALAGFAPVASATTTSTVLYVSATTGADSATCGPAASPCKSITQAVTNATAGDTVKVAAGSYDEQVTLSKRLTLVGPKAGNSYIPLGYIGWAVVAPPSTADNGFLVTPGGAGSVIRNFVVEGAQGEGILAEHTAHVTIEGNLVVFNDLGAFQSTPSYPECAGSGSVPGDCGEGIHLMSTSDSVVARNTLFQDSGGVLLTDEMGPSAHNVVAYNTVYDNSLDCGITLASHNPAAAPNGVPAPKMGGVYANRIIDNTSDNNGVLGFGAGVILAGPIPGTAVYGNVVQGNILYDNGLGGVTIHAHAKGEYMDNNHIVGNVLYGNDTTGNLGKPGDVSTTVLTSSGPKALLTKTADIIVYSAGDTITGTVIRDNSFAKAYYGIWTYHAPSILSGNQFAKSIARRADQSPAPAKVTITGPASAAVGSTITLSGTAEPGQKVRLYRVVNSTHEWLAATMASATGAWKLKVTLAKSDEVFQAFSYGQRSRWLTVK